MKNSERENRNGWLSEGQGIGESESDSDSGLEREDPNKDINKDNIDGLIAFLCKRKDGSAGGGDLNSEEDDNDQEAPEKEEKNLHNYSEDDHQGDIRKRGAEIELTESDDFKI